MKNGRQRIFNLAFGIALMLAGAGLEFYDFIIIVFFRVATLDFHTLIVEFAIPLALIYYGYDISMQRELHFPLIFR